MFLPYNKHLTENARSLRRKSTPEEKKLWYQFLSRHSERFQRQKVIESYILDFYCAQCRLGIEVDGRQHSAEAAAQRDAARTQLLNQYGVTVIRFSNEMVRRQFGEVCKQIDRQVEQLLQDPPPFLGEHRMP